jgi:hypothetical protein
MGNKINIAEILENCPKGMKLYSPIFGDVYLDKIRPHLAIVVTTHKEQGDFKEEFLYDGRYGMNGECMLFPSKANCDWTKFIIPFKQGDIVAKTSISGDTWVGIFMQREGFSESFIPYCSIDFNGKFYNKNTYNHSYKGVHIATSEEKQKLFDAIKANGYKWNPETKTLEKLIAPWTIKNAKDGDVIFCDSGWTCIFKNIHGIWFSSYCFITDEGEFHTGYERHAVDSTVNGNGHPATKEQCDRLFQKIKEAGYKWNPETKTLEKINPKFKVGDRIVNKNGICVPILITKVGDEYYYSNTENSAGVLSISSQDEYELVPNKFDISTLVPFESRVLVRKENNRTWRPAVYGCYIKNHYDSFYVLGGNSWRQCIPYEGNEHLSGTTNDCAEYFKTWE